MSDSPSKPSALFVCVHNAGRSQMAAGRLAHLAGDRVEVRSAGSTPANQINPIAIEAMREGGIDITTQRPKVLTPDVVEASDVVITMGGGNVCPIFPANALRTGRSTTSPVRAPRRRGRSATRSAPAWRS